ncbi:MAG TPA: disulfide bond formation protein DsbA [Dermatophilaceae bacterium]|nr:disulfide bond formation protein DsbA [Dermatophilaceae bacterium]
MASESQAVTPERTHVKLFVDPTCPYAWITSRWLVEVADAGRIDLQLGLVSLAVINDGRDLDETYRGMMVQAWSPSRVALAVLTAHGPGGLRRFYDAYGRRRHVESAAHSRETLEAALLEAGQERGLADAGEDPGWDEQLRIMTAQAVDPVDNPDIGTPIVHLAGRSFFGPVFTWIPRGAEAVHVFEALLAMAGHPAFVELKRGRPDGPITA